MKSNLEMLLVSEVFYNVHYEIPIYQRNYAWDNIQIEQLIDDINTSEDNYFLGNLIVNQKDNNLYEVIDGQQRLTTLYLLGRYLGMSFGKAALRFEAREKSNKTLAVIGLPYNELIEELQSTEIINGYKIIEDYFMRMKIVKDEFINKLSKVKLIRVQVPSKIDLNHYFEIMNTRGEQLELHEIAKASLLAKLETPIDKKIATDIWEACSNMDSYVQMNYIVSLRGKIFSTDWTSLSEKVISFDSLRDIYKGSESEEESSTLISILTDKKKIEDKAVNNDEENERFESIISFPNFLLQVNAVITQTNGVDSSLDDKKFLNNLSVNWVDRISAENFFFELLECRVLFDKYILKREYAKDYKESGKWSLQSLEKYTDDKGNKPKYLSTFGENGINKNRRIRALQSALRITYTSPKTMHWISLVLANYIKDKDTDLINILEKYAIGKVVESKYIEAKGFGFERIVFSYLDYLLYRDGYTYEEKPIINALDKDWQFQFRSSIEHFYPQNPTDENKIWDYKDLHGFGNLALITISGNSKFSNLTPTGKISSYQSIISQSLKLQIMKSLADQESGWTEETSKSHEIEMFKILEEEIMKYK